MIVIRQLKRNVSVVEFCGILRKALPLYPTCRLDLREPVLCRGNAPQVFLYMLFPDVTHWNLLAFAVSNGDTEDSFAQKDSFRMVPKSAMPEIRKDGFGLVKPAMDPQVVLGLAAEFPGAAFCVLHWVSHG
jgi:hypothetical protein